MTDLYVKPSSKWPLYTPWLREGTLFSKHYAAAKGRTLVYTDRCYILHALLTQAIGLPGEVWEFGVYKGGTAAMMAALLNQHAPNKSLRLFDTFAGLPDVVTGVDKHAKGDFSYPLINEVRSYVGGHHRYPGMVAIEAGMIPEGLLPKDLRREVCFAHVDVDLRASTLAALTAVWPLLVTGGVVVVDDYGFPTCPGAKDAVDAFFADSPFVPLCLPTGQAVIIKTIPVTPCLST